MEGTTLPEFLQECVSQEATGNNAVVFAKRMEHSAGIVVASSAGVNRSEGNLIK